MNLLAWLGAVALRSLLLAGGAGLALAAIGRRRRAALATWTVVLYGALAMPLLTLLLPRLRVAVPVPPSAAVARTAVMAAAAPAAGAIPPAPSGETGATASPGAIPAASPQVQPRRLDGETLGLGIYFGGLVVLLARLAAGMVWTGRLARSLQPLPELGPDVAEAEAIVVPAAMGILRPRVVLPASWRAWDPAMLRAVLAHERAHLARHDALTQRLALLHQAVFWFSPLSWWLHGHLGELAEENSDREVLLAGIDPPAYAAMLVAFLNDRRRGGRRVRWQTVAMARSANAEKRLKKILQWKGGENMGANQSRRPVAALAVVPLAFALGAAQPSLARRGGEAGAELGPRTPELQPSMAALPAAATPAPAPPQEGILISSGVLAGQCISCPPPVYPPEAKADGTQGAITLTELIGSDGAVKNLQWTSGEPRLVAAAVNAVSQWRYSPYRLDGKPVEATSTVTLMFNLSPPPAPTAAGPSSLRGRVVDEFGGAIAGARIILGGTTLATTSKADGSYEFPGLAPGVYSFAVDAPGFAISSGVTAITAGTDTDLAFCLHVGNMRQTVEVTGTMPPPPAPAPVVQAPVPTQVSGAICANCPPPVYPPIAYQAHIQGDISLNVLIGPDGKVQSMDNGGNPNLNPLLLAATQHAVQGWTFVPTARDGVPVSASARVTATFRLNCCSSQ